MRSFIFLFLGVLFSHSVCGQGCCSGGCGNPIAGGASPGVLLEKQMEIGSSFQYIDGNQFFAGNKDTAQMFDKFNSRYVYSRIAYGVTKDLTVSVESGYFINKTQIGLNKIDTVKSSGIGDLILFPKYDVLNRTTEKKRIEITLGLGYKIPLGKHNDSTLVYTNPNTGKQTFATSPPLVQPTNGSQDIILYAFFYRGFPVKKFRVFANTTYIRKGWNSLGQKFGDYTSIGLFAGKTIFRNLSLTLQLKGELINKMQYDKNIDMLALYNIDVRSTGSKKIFFVPQISYTYQSLTLFALAEIPLYQYLNGVQVTSRHQVTMGISYRFFTAKPKLNEQENIQGYICPMKCEGSFGNLPGKCKICGMELIKQK